METQTFTLEEVWTIACLASLLVLFVFALIAYGLYLFDKHVFKPYQENRKPLRYEPGSKTRSS
jgi:hypothetical protein